jgi:hypothetical protein
MEICDVDNVANNSITSSNNNHYSNDASSNSQECQTLYISLHGKKLLKKAPKRGDPSKKSRKATKNKVTMSSKENAKITQDNFLREFFDFILVSNIKKNIPFILSLTVRPRKNSKGFKWAFLDLRDRKN